MKLKLTPEQKKKLIRNTIIIIAIILCLCLFFFFFHKKSVPVTSTNIKSSDQQEEPITAKKEIKDIVQDKLKMSDTQDNNDKLKLYESLIVDPKFTPYENLVGLSLPETLNVIDENNNGLKLGTYSKSLVIVLTSTDDDYYSKNIQSFNEFEKLTDKLGAYKVIYLNRKKDNNAFYKKYKGSYCVDNWDDKTTAFMKKFTKSVVVFVNTNHKIEAVLDSLNGYSASSVAADIFGSNVSGKSIMDMSNDILKNPDKYKDDFNEEKGVIHYDNLKEIKERYGKKYKIKNSIVLGKDVYKPDMKEITLKDNSMLSIVYKLNNKKITYIASDNLADFSIDEYTYTSVVRQGKVEITVFGENENKITDFIIPINNTYIEIKTDGITKDEMLKIAKQFED